MEKEIAYLRSELKLMGFKESRLAKELGIGRIALWRQLTGKTKIQVKTYYKMLEIVGDLERLEAIRATLKAS